MANSTKPILNVQDGVEFAKENGKFEDGKFKMEKTATRKFLEQAGAPKPVQEAYQKANETLRATLCHIGGEMLEDAIKSAKKKGASKDELKDIRVECVALGDDVKHNATFYAAKENRIPQTNEVVVKYGVCRYVEQVKRLGVSKEDTEQLQANIEAIITKK